MKRLLNILIFIYGMFAAGGCGENEILNPSERLTGTIPILDIYIEEEDYRHLLANHAFNTEVPCKIFYREEAYTGIIRPQGAGSRLKPKWAYKIILKKGDLIEGLNEFNLSAQVYDKTLLKTTVASEIYKQLGFKVFANKHLFLKINNSDQGLYPLIERVEQPFFDKRGLPVNELFKLGFDSRFTFSSPYNPQFYFNKEIPDNENYNTLIEFIHAVDTSNSERVFETLGKHLRIEQYIEYHAITSLINNFDAFTNNFFLYKRYANHPFEIIPWDFDKTFFEEADAGLAGENGIVKKLFSNPAALNLYKERIKYHLNSVFTEENIFPIIDSTAVLIKEFYMIDPYLNGVYNFDNEIDNLKDYITGRREFFINNIDQFEGFN